MNTIMKIGIGFLSGGVAGYIGSTLITKYNNEKLYNELREKYADEFESEAFQNLADAINETQEANKPGERIKDFKEKITVLKGGKAV